MLLFDISSTGGGGSGGGETARVRSLEEFEERRCWELMDGLRIIVITKRSSTGGVGVDFRLGSGIFKNEERLLFELCDVASDEVDEAGEGDDDNDLIIRESTERRWEVDCALHRGLKWLLAFSSVIFYSKKKLFE